MTPEETFNLLADAAGVRHPHPDRDNRGLCPAHGDQHNPALVFKIGDTGNLVAFCHSQHCTIKMLASAIGVTPAAFFATSGGAFTETVTIQWVHRPTLDLLKLVPLEYDHDDLVECVMRTLHLDLDYATMPIGELTKTDWLALGGIWLEPGYSFDTHGDWWHIYHAWTAEVRRLDRETRTDPNARVSAIPLGGI